MKSLVKNYKNPDSGIAIMFTLIMLSVFFLISFGFISMATTSKAASKAREPQQNTSVNASESILNEAVACIEERIYSGSLEYPDTSLFQSLRFSNSSVNVDLQVWGTSASTTNNTDLEDALLLQLEPSAGPTEEIKINTSDANWPNFSWITPTSGDDYAWMVIESNGLDPNYLGGSGSGVVTGNRLGKYTRELDMRIIDPTNGAGIYKSWDDIQASSDIPWESKKQLIGALATDYETAVEIYQIGISPIQLKDITSRYDLNTLQTDTSSTPSIVLSNISWLNDGAAGYNKIKNQIAANIKDYIDQDTKCTYDSVNNVYGVERTPQINEISVLIQNKTPEPPTDGMGNYTSTSQSSILVRCQAEFVNLFNAGSWGASPTGANCRLEVDFTITAERNGNNAINVSDSVVVNDFDLSSFAGYTSSPVVTDAAVIELTVPGTDLQETSELTNITVTITKATLYGTTGGGEIWDVAVPATASSPWSIETEKYAYCAFQVEDARVNDTGWDSGTWADVTTPLSNILDTLNTNNDNFITGRVTWEENETAATFPWEFSTAYMPLNGGITSLDELGLISRGEKGKTLNLVDYNIQDSVKIGNYKPTSGSGTLLNNTNTFDGGDRAILDFVRINTGTSYKQFSSVNPNTTNEAVLSFLFNGITTAKGSSISATEINNVVQRFPGVDSLNANEIFYVADFHDTTTDGFHNRNPKTYGYVFSKYSNSYITDGNTDSLTDAQRESLLIKSMNLISPKYSYYTILTAVKDDSTTPATISSYYNFVRRDNESGSYKFLFQIQN